MTMDLNASGAKVINGAGGGTSAGDPLTQIVSISQAAGSLGAIPVQDTASEAALGTTGDASWAGSGAATIVALLKAIALRLGLGASAAQDGSGTVATPGTAQALFGGATPANGFMVQNTSDFDLWISDVGTAAAGGASVKLAPGSAPFVTPPYYKPPGAVSLFGANAGSFMARRW